jgi:peptidoglycan hydrolase CwlO-like protein
MRIIELVSEQTIAPVPPGQNIPQPAGGQPTSTANTATNATLGNQTPQPAQQMGQPPVDPAQQQQIQQVQQSSKTAMTDLDKIAAQIVGLKQKQQELQQQTQKIGL